MRIIVSQVEIPGDDPLIQFYMTSSYWGEVKNSLLLLDGKRLKDKNTRTGVFEYEGNNFEAWGKKAANVIDVNRHNQAAPPVLQNSMSQLVELCQRKYKAAPVYEVVEIAGECHQPEIEIRMTLPSGKVHQGFGANKRAAANNLAQKLITENNY